MIKIPITMTMTPTTMPPMLIVWKIAPTMANTMERTICEATYIPAVIHARADISSIRSQAIPAITPATIKTARRICTATVSLSLKIIGKTINAAAIT